MYYIVPDVGIGLLGDHMAYRFYSFSVVISPLWVPWGETLLCISNCMGFQTLRLHLSYKTGLHKNQICVPLWHYFNKK